MKGDLGVPDRGFCSGHLSGFHLVQGEGNGTQVGVRNQMSTDKLGWPLSPCTFFLPSPLGLGGGKNGGARMVQEAEILPKKEQQMLASQEWSVAFEWVRP